MGLIIGGILAAMVIIGYLAQVFMPSSDSPFGDTAVWANRAAADSLSGIMSSTQQGFQTMQTAKGVSAVQILFNGSETGLNGVQAALIEDKTDVLYTRQLFHPQAGTIASPPAFPVTASASSTPGAATFYYRSNLALRGGAGAVPLELGSALPEVTMIAPNIRTGVCMSLNAHLYSDVEDDPTAIPASGLALSAFTGTDSTTTTVVTAPAGMRARTMGCVGTTDGAYVAFLALYKR